MPQKEDERGDPFTKITHWLTRGIHNLRELFGVQDRTRVLSRPAFEYFGKYDFAGSKYGLDNPMYTYLSHEDQVLMISHEGRGREEAVLLSTGLGEDQDIYDRMGIQMIRDFRKRQRKLKDFGKAPEIEQ